MGKRAVVGLGSIDRDVQNSARAAALAAQPVTAESRINLPVETHARIVSATTAAGTPTLAPVIRLSSPSLPDTRTVTRYERLLKPMIDKVLAFVLLVVLSPILAVVGVMVAKSLGRPIVLRQQRVGKDEERFVLHKFRTMHPDRRASGGSTRGEFDGDDRRITHKHPDDPRLTPVGQTLRKWSLDELPQLYDVLKGTLSIVGPRPELESIVANYEPWQHARHAVKPGLTGLWQIKARGDGEMHEHTDLDIEYAQKVTLRGDLKIMLLTLPAILTRKGY
jgi:lipopolysaccharide/colanic/teichoic acid biosynthesis glycosyltransferase